MKKGRTKFFLVIIEVFVLGILAGVTGLFILHQLGLFPQTAETKEEPSTGKIQWEPIEESGTGMQNGAETDADNPQNPDAENNPDVAKDSDAVNDTDTSGKGDTDAAGESGKTQEPGVYYKEAATPGEVTLLFAGDVLFDDSYSPMVSLKRRENGVDDCFSKELLQEMRDADIFMLNNEFTFTDRGEPLADKSYTFRSRPENVKYLFDMGADLVSLANNHSFDFGEISLLDTLDTLERAGMPQVGAGRNLEEAEASVFFEVDGIRIGFLSATQIERMKNPPTRGATQTEPGVFRCLDPAELYRKVEETKKLCDYLVVFIHWGTEKTDEVDWAQKEQGPGLAAAGADLVIGAHPHVLQGLDSADGVPIVNSLGNFWFNSFTLDTCVVKVTLDKNGLKSFQFLPALQKDCRTVLTQGAEKKRVLDYMRSLSPHVQIDEEGYVTFM